jgi:hypothetical protein
LLERFQVLADKKFISVKKSSKLVLTFGIWRSFQEFFIHHQSMTPSKVQDATVSTTEPHLPLVSSPGTYKRATQSPNVDLGDALRDDINNQSGDESGTGGTH